MAGKKKKDAALAPAPKVVKKETYKPKLHIPAGNPDRHIVRVANKTWLVAQPGSATFIGHYGSKKDAMIMAERHVAITKGTIVCHD